MYKINEAIDEYMDLVRVFPLISISDDQHLDEAIKVLHRLLEIPARSEGQDAYLGALGDIIEAYETTHIDIPRSSGLEMLTHLMEASDLKQKDMDFVFGNKAVTSAVLSGARPIGLTHAPAERTLRATPRCLSRHPLDAPSREDAGTMKSRQSRRGMICRRSAGSARRPDAASPPSESEGGLAFRPWIRSMGYTTMSISTAARLLRAPIACS